ncbi:MAG: 50S ribosomal protein L20 [Magnetococcales bacterium]|nr:50S ribosomal protein L20 [Magnetococcales bacterium]MEC8066517.1 50S ribosomal protein L20 [Pseudomonadota bacterium]|tara:strand:+ start:33600 stop:33956 length:357 start_codon:yes stop_codon:yes gene_type:complete
MSRVKGGAAARARHKKVIKMAKGYRGRAKSCFRTAIQKVEKGLQYAYRDRRTKKREFRRLWITRINAAARQNGLTYSTMMNGLKHAEVEIDRKVLAWIAMNDEKAFAELAEKAKAAAK